METNFRNQKALQQEQAKGRWTMQKDLVPNVSPRSSEVIGAATSDETATEAERVLRKLIELRWQREVIERWAYSSQITAESREQLRELLSRVHRELQALEVSRGNRIEDSRTGTAGCRERFSASRKIGLTTDASSCGTRSHNDVDCSLDLGSLTEAESG